MQLADSTLLQVLLSAGNVVTLWQVLDDLLSRPATWEQSGLRLRKAPLHIGHEAIVRARGAELIRVLKIKSLVGTTWLNNPINIQLLIDIERF